MNRMHIKRVVC